MSVKARAVVVSLAEALRTAAIPRTPAVPDIRALVVVDRPLHSGNDFRIPQCFDRPAIKLCDPHVLSFVVSLDHKVDGEWGGAERPFLYVLAVVGAETVTGL